MKKLLIGLMFAMVCAVGHAESLSIADTLQKVPGMKQGAAFSLVDSKFNYLSTLDVAKFKDLTLEVGYAGRAKLTGDKVVAVVSYPIFNAKEFGITWPIADLIDLRLGAYAGYGRVEIGSIDTMKGNNELDFGASLTAISVKF